MYNQVEVSSRRHNGLEVVDAFTLAEVDDAGHDRKVWVIPIQAVASRSELFGLDSNESSLEFLGHSIARPEVEGEITQEVHPLYAEHLNQEARALEMGSQPLAKGRTLMAMDGAVESNVASKLDEVRSTGLQKLGMGGVAAMSRMSGAPHTASVAMDASDEVVQRILEVCTREQALLDAWRLDMVFATCPRIQDLMKKG